MPAFTVFSAIFTLYNKNYSEHSFIQNNTMSAKKKKSVISFMKEKYTVITKELE